MPRIRRKSADGLQRRLLAWYDRNRRVLPWRALPGERAEPYFVWLSEIMLQQTTVAAVAPYYRAFVQRWPSVHDLAAAELDAVLHAWQGLGYYARARNLHRCAERVSRELGGVFPSAEAALASLPGIGPYTAAAIAAIAFDRPAAPVDGNVERVMARLYAIETPLPAAKAELGDLARGLTPQSRPGDYAQAVMDLGATICTPRRPDCARCPWRDDCAARQSGLAAALPRRAPKTRRPVRHGMAFFATKPDGSILVCKRPLRGLLGGMAEIPSTDWRGILWTEDEARRSAPVSTRWALLPGLVRHTFTHFHLEIRVLAGALPRRARTPANGSWCPPDRLGEHAFPSVMKKIVRHALRHA